MAGEIQGFQMSLQQEYLWLLQQSNEGPAYRSQCAVLLEEHIDREKVKEAIRAVVSRHEILRTNFLCTPIIKLPLQRVMDAPSYMWQEVDLHDMAPLQQEIQIEQLFQEILHEPLDMEQGPILQVHLIILSTNAFVLLISLPSLAADSTSLKNVVHEICTLYTSRAQLQPPSLEEPLQYIQFSGWQRALLEDDAESAEGKEYWHRQAQERPLSITQLPLRRGLYASSTFEVRSIRKIVHTDVFNDISIYLSCHKVSLPAFLLTCWLTLLWRLSGEATFAIGCVLHERKFEDLYNALGLFNTTLPFNSRFEDSSLFHEMVEQVSLDIETVSGYQEYFDPTTLLRRDAPYFDFLFEFNTHFSHEYADVGIACSLIKHYACNDRFRIKLTCIQQENELLVDFFYDASAVESEDIHTLTNQFLALLENACSTTEIAVHRIPFLSTAERTKLLTTWNQVEATPFFHQSFHHLFEEQVQRTPDQPAIFSEDRHITYYELNQQANRLAHYLSNYGVGPDVLAGICLERSFELVGLLAILKAGGAFVSLSSRLPDERLAFMLIDTHAPVVLTQRKFSSRFLNKGVQIIDLDAIWDHLEEQGSDNPDSEVTAQNLAYVMYTSGSTGRPKGVLIEHHSLTNYLCWCTHAYEMDKGGSVPVHTPIEFDLTITSLLAPLLVGQSVFLFSEESIEMLSRHLGDSENTGLLKVTPSHLSLLAQLIPTQQASWKMRTLVIGGEPLSAEVLSFWRVHATATKLINEYGPTETVVGCCAYEVPTDFPPSGSVPIGRPIANTQIYILDEYMEPVPIGVQGELYVGGAGVARGYLNQPARTAEKFLPHPFISEPGARLYRTGDIASYLPDGTIKYLGRSDNQVKLRGYRIELDEIEAVLNEHPAIRQNVVALREAPSGAKHLIAYPVLDPQHSLTTPMSALRSFLLKRLPNYMVPDTFIPIDSLPLTSHGKVKRQALPLPESFHQEKSFSGLRFIAARTAEERILSDIWMQVLHIKQIGIHDNFFELGGDSILSVQVIARAIQAGLHLVPKQLFQYPTIAELAAVAGTVQKSIAEQGLLTGVVPLSPIQHWFFEQDLHNPHHWNMAILFELSQPLTQSLLETALRHLLIQHDALRLHFKRDEATWRQFYVPPSETIPFVYIDLSALPGESWKAALEAIANHAQRSLNIVDGPLMRFILFDVPQPDHQRLALIIHHLVVDSVSGRILLEDLQNTCIQLLQGKEITPTPKTASMKQWSLALRDYAQSPVLLQERAFWLSRLQDTSALPIDLPAGINTEGSARSITVVLNKEETDQLLHKVPQVYHTQINDILLTAIIQAFCTWTGRNSLLMDLEGHGREDISPEVDLSRTVGWFTTIFPVLFQLEGATPPADALKSLKEQLRSIPQRGIGYGIWRYLSPDEEAGAQLRVLPQAQVSFNYLGQFDQIMRQSPLFSPAAEAYGNTRDPNNRRRYLLEIVGNVFDEQLQLTWTYSEQVYHYTTIERLANASIEKLHSLITYCLLPDSGGYTPSDFPASRLSQQELDDIMAKLEEFER